MYKASDADARLGLIYLYVAWTSINNTRNIIILTAFRYLLIIIIGSSTVINKKLLSATRASCDLEVFLLIDRFMDHFRKECVKKNEKE